MTTSDISEITSSITLSNGVNNYSINATGGNITLTLPSITGDGINWKLIRYDTSQNTVSLVTTSPDLLYLNIGVTGISSYDIPPVTVIEIQSLNSSWHVTINSSIT